VYENIDRITYETIKFISNSDLLLHNALSTVSRIFLIRFLPKHGIKLFWKCVVNN
jgi:hypothetical protein